MKCVNCGASYPDVKSQCPYCGSENTKRAEYEHQNKLAWYEFKSSILRILPEMLGRFASKLVTRLLVLFIVGGILLILLSAVLAKFKSTIEYGKKDYVLEQLETMYQEEDYQSMMELLKEQEHYTGATYGRYYRIGELFELYQPVEKEIDEKLQAADVMNDAEFLRYTINPMFRILCYCDEYKEEDFVYDEGEEVEAFRQKVESILKEKCFLSEEEIRQGMQLYINNGDMMEIYQIVLERYQEK